MVWLTKITQTAAGILICCHFEKQCTDLLSWRMFFPPNFLFLNWLCVNENVHKDRNLGFVNVQNKNTGFEIPSLWLAIAFMCSTDMSVIGYNTQRFKNTRYTRCKWKPSHSARCLHRTLTHTGAFKSMQCFIKCFIITHFNKWFEINRR